ncbi:MAG: lysylphosphatidylglycerol synthase transmembrane domain-containing protein [Ferruginibacter sp.]
MRKRFLSILQYVIFLGGGIFLVWWQLRSLTAKEEAAFLNAFDKANYWLIVPVTILILLSHLSRAMRWKLLMEPLGYDPATKNVFAVTLVGYFANAAFPRLGEILKCTFLARYEHLKVEKLVGTIIVEKAFDIICYIIFIGITIIIQIDRVGSYLQNKLTDIAILPGFPLWGTVLIALSVIFIFYLFLKLLFRQFPGNKIVLKIKDFLKGIFEGFKSIRHLNHRRSFIIHTIFIWGAYLSQIYIAFYAMSGTEHLGIKAAFSVLTLATLSMILTPGGIGTFPLFIAETLIMYDIAKELGVAFGWLMWGISTGIIIIAGLIALLLLPYINKKKKNEISSVDTV